MSLWDRPGVGRISRWLVATTVVSVVAGCGYAPATVTVSGGGRTICAPRVPQTAAELQVVFDTRGPWWAGADGGFVVELPDGRRLWLFGDTVVGQVDPVGRRYLERNRMANNSLVVQTGRCFEVRMQGAPGGPTRSALVHPEPGSMWWPVSGFHDPVTNKVLVFAMRQSSRNWWVGQGMDLVELSWPGLDYLGYRALPFDTVAGFAAMGTTLLVDGGWLYLYGAPVRGLVKAGFVARTVWPMAAAPAFEYLSGDGWTTDRASAVAMDAGGRPVQGVLQVHKVPSGYVAVNKPFDGINEAVWQWRSATPFGPWTFDRELVGPVRYNVRGWTYGVRTYPLGNGRWFLLRSENPVSMDELYADTLSYGIRFADWEPPR